jgi:hypothetical protein
MGRHECKHYFKHPPTDKAYTYHTGGEYSAETNRAGLLPATKLRYLHTFIRRKRADMLGYQCITAPRLRDSC